MSKYKGPNKIQSRILKAYSYDPKDFLFIYETAETMYFKHIKTGIEVPCRR